MWLGEGRNKGVQGDNVASRGRRRRRGDEEPLQAKDIVFLEKG